MKNEALFFTFLSVLMTSMCNRSLNVKPLNWRKYLFSKENQTLGSDPTDSISTLPSEGNEELIPVARYIVHTAEWASVVTVSSVSSYKGYPFSSIEPVADGPLGKSSAIPYFYLSPFTPTARNLRFNKSATLLISLEKPADCEILNMDVKGSRCLRLMITGKIKKVKKGTSENSFARSALFGRHPALVEFPLDYNWSIVKPKIAQIALIDWYGSPNYISVNAYRKYNYTGKELREYFNYK